MIENLDILRLLIATLAIYRLSQLFPKDDGPFFIFERIRLFTEGKSLNEQEKELDDEERGRVGLGIWSNINEGVHCGLCGGWYIALLIIPLVFFPSFWGDLFLLWQGMAGAQAMIWRKVE